MKAYIKPSIEVTVVEMQPLMDNSITSTAGLNGVTMGEGDFSGGAADSRRGGIWDDED